MGGCPLYLKKAPSDGNYVSSLVKTDGGHVTQVAQVRHSWHAHTAELQAAIVCDHLCENVENRLSSDSGQPPRFIVNAGWENQNASTETYLGHGLVVDSDQVSRLWVDLQALVERKRSLDSSRWVGAQALTLGHLLQEVGLLLLDARGEALLLSLVDDLLDDLALVLGLSFGIHPGLSNLPPLVTPQLSSELGLIASCVVEVDGVG